MKNEQVLWYSLGQLGSFSAPAIFPVPCSHSSVSCSKLRPEVILPHFQSQIIKGPVTFQGHRWTLITKQFKNPDWLPQRPHERNWGYPQSAMATGTDFSCSL